MVDLLQQTMAELMLAWGVAGPLVGKAVEEGSKEVGKKLVDFLTDKFAGNTKAAAALEGAKADPDKMSLAQLKGVLEVMVEDEGFRKGLEEVLGKAGGAGVRNSMGDVGSGAVVVQAGHGARIRVGG